MERPVVELHAEVDADVDTVWRALTTPSLIRQYFLGAEVETDWRVGHPIRFRGEWKGDRFQDKGEIREYEAPHVLSYTHWSEMPGKPDRPENYHFVRFVLDARGRHTEVTFTQSNVGDAPAPDEETRAESRRNWETMLEGLKRIAERETFASTR
jgi:uncharacterized protein YndB with AHSA1/START domain